MTERHSRGIFEANPAWRDMLADIGIAHVDNGGKLKAGETPIDPLASRPIYGGPNGPQALKDFNDSQVAHPETPTTTVGQG